MPDLVIAQNIPQAQIDAIVAAFVERQGPIPPGTPAVLDGQGQVVTPAVPQETPAQFARRKIREYIRSVVKLSQAEAAAQSARTTAAAQADTEMTGF